MSRPSNYIRYDLAGGSGSQSKFFLFLLFLPILPIVILVSIGFKLRKRSKRIRAQTEFALDCREKGIHKAEQVAVEWIKPIQKNTKSVASTRSLSDHSEVLSLGSGLRRSPFDFCT